MTDTGYRLLVDAMNTVTFPNSGELTFQHRVVGRRIDGTAELWVSARCVAGTFVEETSTTSVNSNQYYGDAADGVDYGMPSVGSNLYRVARHIDDGWFARFVPAIGAARSLYSVHVYRPSTAWATMGGGDWRTTVTTTPPDQPLTDIVLAPHRTPPGGTLVADYLGTPL